MALFGTKQPPGVLGYDPAAMRRQAISRGLLGAGIGLLSQGASPYPIGFGQSIGQGLHGFAQGADQGREQYRDDWKSSYEMAELQRKRQEDQDFETKWLPQFSEDEKQAYYADKDTFRKTFASEMAKSKYGTSGDEYGLAPFYAKDAEGNIVPFQTRKSGGAKKIDLPEGFTPTPGVDRIDLGTAWGITDRSGNVVGTIPKDVAGAQEQTAIGKGQGEAAASLASMKSKMPGLEKTVAELDRLAEQATYTVGGRIIDEGIRQMGLEPRESAVARASYIAIVDNQILPLLRDTFGAQFTEREGETLRATLGSPNVSPKEKQAVLKAFIEQKRRDVEALAGQAGQAPANGGGGYVIEKVE